MVDQHPFLFETLTQLDNKTFLFQQDLLFPTTLQSGLQFLIAPNTHMFSSL
jgi:hypothetical protein